MNLVYLKRKQKGSCKTLAFQVITCLKAGDMVVLKSDKEDDSAGILTKDIKDYCMVDVITKRLVTDKFIGWVVETKDRYKTIRL